MMTDVSMCLRGPLRTSADTNFLRKMIGFAAQRLMELEAGEVNRCCVRRGGYPISSSASSPSGRTSGRMGSEQQELVEGAYCA